MGATVTTGKAVFGFNTKNNEVIYVLAEETYEKNCFPHSPNWGVCAIGNYAEVMTRVFDSASSAEGGSLTNRSNNLTPETYLRGWNLAFNKAEYFQDREITLQILNKGIWRNGITSQSVGELLQALKELNRMDIWEKLISDDDKVKISLHDDIEVIRSIFGVNGFEQPWKILDYHGHKTGLVDVGLIPAKRNGEVMPEKMPRLVKIKATYTDQFVELQGNRYVNARWYYSLMGDYVRNQAYACEMIQSGLGIKNITLLREVLDSEPDSGNDLEAFIDKSSITPDLVSQFEYNVGIKFEDMDEVHQLPSAQFALERVSSSIKVYFKRKNGESTGNPQLLAA